MSLLFLHRGSQPLSQICHWQKSPSSTNLHLSRQDGVSPFFCSLQGRQIAHQRNVWSGLPCLAGLLVLTTLSPSPQALRQQMLCQSRLPAPAPSSCPTMPRKFWCFLASWRLLCLFLTLVLTHRAPSFCHMYVPPAVPCVCCDPLCEQLLKHNIHLRKHLVLSADKCSNGNFSLSFFPPFSCHS